jgi:hypothetical protein
MEFGQRMAESKFLTQVIVLGDILGPLAGMVEPTIFGVAEPSQIVSRAKGSRLLARALLEGERLDPLCPLVSHVTIQAIA